MKLRFIQYIQGSFSIFGLSVIVHMYACEPPAAVAVLVSDCDVATPAQDEAPRLRRALPLPI